MHAGCGTHQKKPNQAITGDYRSASLMGFHQQQPYYQDSPSPGACNSWLRIHTAEQTLPPTCRRVQCRPAGCCCFWPISSLAGCALLNACSSSLRPRICLVLVSVSLSLPHEFLSHFHDHQMLSWLGISSILQGLFGCRDRGVSCPVSCTAISHTSTR